MSSTVPEFDAELFQEVMATEPGPFSTLDSMWLAFQPLANNKTPAINGEKNNFLACFVVGRTVIRPVGAPTRRSWAWPGPDDLTVACIADEIAQ